MLKHSDVQEFIKTAGMKTMADIKEKFASEDPEILQMALKYLTEKNRIRHAEYQSPSGAVKIYYIPKQ